MILVLLILAFMAGIMVGNCRHSNTLPNAYVPLPQPTSHARKHRGMHDIAPAKKHTATITKNTDAEVGGFVVEIDQAE